jgi:hypothetical protein
MKRHARALAWVASAAALSLVFTAYLRPDMMLALATQVWNCF